MFVLQSTDHTRRAQFHGVCCRSLDESFKPLARVRWQAPRQMKTGGRRAARHAGKLQKNLEAIRQKPAASPSRRLSLAAT